MLLIQEIEKEVRKEVDDAITEAKVCHLHRKSVIVFS